MIEHPYRTLLDVVADDLFPEADMALRRGRHVDAEQTALYTFLSDTQTFLEPFYRRFGGELVRSAEGYFYLLPLGGGLPRRTLSAGAMLTGQALALLYLDPATVQAAGVVEKAQVVELLSNLVGEEKLLAALNPRRRRRVAAHKDEETVRQELDRALRDLERLGFLDQLPDGGLRLRAPLLRFADPVRSLEDPLAALERMLAGGFVELEPAGEDEEEDEEP